MINHETIYRFRIVFIIVLAEFLFFLFSGVSFSFLYGNSFFSLEADPLTWFVYLTGIPQFITSNQWPGILLDSLIIISLLYFIWKPFENRIAILLFVLLLLYYVTLMGHLAHHNYQFGFFILFIPFMFRHEQNRYFAFEAVRYFMIFFYFSAAFLKFYYNGLSDTALFSHLACGQYTPYFLEGNTGIRTSFNLYLVSHTSFSYGLYLVSFLLELAFVTGFFTKRFDKWLAVIILVFHFSNWFLMDIAPIGQVAFICLLFFSKEVDRAGDSQGRISKLR